MIVFFVLGLTEEKGYFSDCTHWSQAVSNYIAHSFLLKEKEPPVCILCSELLNMIYIYYFFALILLLKQGNNIFKLGH